MRLALTEALVRLETCLEQGMISMCGDLAHHMVHIVGHLVVKEPLGEIVTQKVVDRNTETVSFSGLTVGHIGIGHIGHTADRILQCLGKCLSLCHHHSRRLATQKSKSSWHCTSHVPSHVHAAHQVVVQQSGVRWLDQHS